MCRRRWEFRKPSAEDGLNGVAVLGVAKALMVYFGSIQETSCPIKHWFDCSRLLSVLMRLEHNQALLPALVLTLLLQHIFTVIALQRREWSAGHFSHFSLLWIVTYTGPQFYIPLSPVSVKINSTKVSKKWTRRENQDRCLLWFVINAHPSPKKHVVEWDECALFAVKQ